MPLCGFKPDMVKGNNLYLKGLLEATLERDSEPKKAIQKETKEICLFIESLKEMYKNPEYTKKRRAKFIYGIAILSQAFFEEAVELSENENMPMVDACQIVIDKTSNFLEEIENEHQKLKKIFSPAETMKKSVEWINDNA